MLANKFIYRFTEPGRGQVIVFESVEDDKNLLANRVVGVAGDTIQLRGGTVYVNGEPQKEPHVHANPCVPYQPKTCEFGPVRVRKGHIFVMGDNKANSCDSRFFGALPLESLEGKAFLSYWAMGRIGLLQPFVLLGFRQ